MSRRRTMVLAGHQGDVETARAGLVDPDGGVRAAALGALRRAGALDAPTLERAFGDPAAMVRCRACEEVAARGWLPPPGAVAWVTDRLEDRDATVVEAACFALGEILGAGAADRLPVDQGLDPVGALSAVANGHADPLCREAAVAALGSVGDRRGLPAILTATGDKAAVRRRAVLALAPFEGADVDAALARALTDRDWQVRQAAEDLTAT